MLLTGSESDPRPVPMHRLLDLLATTTSRFIVEPAAGLMEATLGMLRDIGELFDVDRAYLFQILPDGLTMSNTVEWCADGVVPAISDLQELPVGLFPWWMAQVSAGRAVRLLTLDDLPPEAAAEREILEPQGIQSLLVLPVAYRGALVGFVGFDHVRGTRPWTDEEVSILRFMGSALAHALERQRVESHLARAATVFASSREAFIVTDVQQRIVEVNPAFTAITGLAAVDVLGRSPQDVLGGKSGGSPELDVLWDAWRQGHPVDVEIEVEARDGRVVWLEVKGSPLQGDAEGASGYMAIASDVTERTAQDRMKSEFIATVSHELRTPLTSIAGSLGLLRGGAVGAVDDGAQRILDIADRNVQRLTRLVDDLLDVERLAHSDVELHLESHSVDGLLQEAVALNEAAASRHGVAIRRTGSLPGTTVRVDAHRLQQVLANLLSNAAKYSPPGSVVELRAVAADGAVHISVTDEGPGLPPEFHGRVFDRFAMADATDAREKGGTGLGLAIAKALTELMDGELTFQSPPGGGAEFTVRLPLD